MNFFLINNKFSEKDFNKIRCQCLKIGNDITKKFKKLESKLPLDDDFSTLARMKRWLYFGFFHQYVTLWSKNEQFLMDLEKKSRKKLQIQSQICKFLKIMIFRNLQILKLIFL